MPKVTEEYIANKKRAIIMAKTVNYLLGLEA